MNVINLSPESFVYFFVCLVCIYAAIRAINLGFKYTEKRLNLR